MPYRRYAGSKYGAKKVTEDGYTFDSKAEHARYLELLLLARAGEITDLEVHPVFLLQEAFKDGMGKHQRKIEYEADFQYIEDGVLVVEDVKGVETPVFKLKRKLFLYRYREIDFRVIK